MYRFKDKWNSAKVKSIIFTYNIKEGVKFDPD